MRLLLSSPYLLMRKPDGKPLTKAGSHELLKDWSGGDSTVLDRLIPLVYDELHRLAINTCDVKEQATCCKRPH